MVSKVKPEKIRIWVNNASLFLLFQKCLNDNKIKIITKREREREREREMKNFVAEFQK